MHSEDSSGDSQDTVTLDEQLTGYHFALLNFYLQHIIICIFGVNLRLQFMPDD